MQALNLLKILLSIQSSLSLHSAKALSIVLICVLFPRLSFNKICGNDWRSGAISYKFVLSHANVKANTQWVYWDQLDANCLVLFYYTFSTLHVSDVIHIHPQERHIMHMPDTAWNGSTHTCTYLYQAACALYDAPEDGCVLHPKHLEWKKCNKITLNNLHQAGPSKPIIYDIWGSHGSNYQNNVFLDGIIPEDTRHKVPLYHK